MTEPDSPDPLEALTINAFRPLPDPDPRSYAEIIGAASGIPMPAGIPADMPPNVVRLADWRRLHPQDGDLA